MDPGQPGRHGHPAPPRHRPGPRDRLGRCCRRRLRPRRPADAGQAGAAALAAALAAELVDELVAADALLFAVPLYNFGVSQHFKTYVDLVVTDPRMAAGQPSAISGKPAVLATVRGGAYGAGTPREGWDHATPWMRRILEDVWGVDLRAVEEEFALVGVNPALDEFADLAETMRAEAAAQASEHGRALVAALRRAA